MSRVLPVTIVDPGAREAYTRKLYPAATHLYVRVEDASRNIDGSSAKHLGNHNITNAGEAEVPGGKQKRKFQDSSVCYKLPDAKEKKKSRHYQSEVSTPKSSSGL